MTTLPAIAEQPVDELELSNSVKMFFHMNRLKALNELLQRPMEEWFRLAGFSQHLLQDLMRFLKQHALQTYVID
jgi:hypothetical protein